MPQALVRPDWHPRTDDDTGQDDREWARTPLTRPVSCLAGLHTLHDQTGITKQEQHVPPSDASFSSLPASPCQRYLRALAVVQEPDRNDAMDGWLPPYAIVPFPIRLPFSLEK